MSAGLIIRQMSRDRASHVVAELTIRCRYCGGSGRCFADCPDIVEAFTAALAHK
jgi:hypothetical protein